MTSKYAVNNFYSLTQKSIQQCKMDKNHVNSPTWSKRLRNLCKILISGQMFDNLYLLSQHKPCYHSWIS